MEEKDGRKDYPISGLTMLVQQMVMSVAAEQKYDWGGWRERLRDVIVTSPII